MTAKQKQCLLAYLGYYQADIDGIWGPKSQEAARSFQQGANVTETAFEKALLAAICDGKELSFIRKVCRCYSIIRNSKT